MSEPARRRFLGLFSPFPQERIAERYIVALATALLAILLRAVLDPVLGHVAFYVTIYMAVAFDAVVCGVGPAVLSTIVGFLGIFYWFVDPRHSFAVSRPSEIHGIIGCFLVCLVLITLGATNRRKQLRLNQTVAALTAEGAERRRAEQELRLAHDQLELRVEERTVALSHALRRLEAEVDVRQQAERELRRLSVALMTTQDEERRRIARELHDSAGQTLAAIKMAIAVLKSTISGSPAFQSQIEDLNALTDEALREIRTASYLLHPPMLDEVGIASAARWFVDGFSQRSGIQVDCEIPDTRWRPSRHCELVLFRVLQESLTNVHRHSGATAAKVIFSLEPDHIRLEVCDNGSGIPKERLESFNGNAKSGVGISGMRARVQELGGSLDIGSDLTGTTITATLPVQPPSASANSSSSVRPEKQSVH